MLLIQLIGQLPYGMPEFYGQVAVIFCLILQGICFSAAEEFSGDTA